MLPETKGGLLTLTSLYAALHGKGYTEEGDCVMIEGVPVQFLPAYNPLLEEALREAHEMPYQATSTRVLRVLMAICLQTGRAKDREHVRILREQASLDEEYFGAILRRHQLEGKWKEWIA